MSILTTQINFQDSVGDSVGTHNYNALSLDTAICNLSSQFFLSNNNFNSVFSDFSNNLTNFINFSNSFYNPQAYNAVVTTTNLLSSYWNKHEFSVHYPLNISNLNGYSCPTINQPDNTLKSLANVYLNSNYPAGNYTINTIANVIFFLYSVPVNPTNLNLLQDPVNATPTEFSFPVRNMTANITRNNIFFENGKIFKFQNSGKSWNLIQTTAGYPLSAYKNLNTIPQYFNITSRITLPQNGIIIRNSINITISEDTYNYDVYNAAISTGLYIVGNCDITITNNANIGSSSPSSPALTVLSSALNNNIGFAQGDTVTIINNGSIIGAGGNGGVGQSYGSAVNPQTNNGGNGGDAIFLQFPTTIQNNGTISGGGGGGAGGYIGTTSEQTVSTKTSIASLVGGGGGGGGAGSIGGSGGAGGTGFNNVSAILNAVGKKSLSSSLSATDMALIMSNQLNGASGSTGSPNSAGTGGNGGNSNTKNYVGGSGGYLGSPGTTTGPTNSKNNITTYNPPLGGAAGNYIYGKIFANISAQGVVYGNII